MTVFPVLLWPIIEVCYIGDVERGKFFRPIVERIACGDTQGGAVVRRICPKPVLV